MFTFFFGVLLAGSLSSVALGAECPVQAYGNEDGSRITRHLHETEQRLRSRDVPSGAPEIRAERTRNLERLRAYQARGEFPRNTDFADQCVPYFIDDGGRACAVAHLMIESGYGWLADAIATDENNDLLGDIDHESLHEWVARSGLTADELALIQPCYNPPSSCPPTDNQCTKNTVSCHSCVERARPTGTPCDGDNMCFSYACEESSCVEHEARDCDDDNPCTVDSCDGATGCIHEDVCDDDDVGGCGAVPGRQPPFGWLAIAGLAVLAIRRRGASASGSRA